MGFFLRLRNDGVPGENCDAVERLYIHEDVYDAFVEAYVAMLPTHLGCQHCLGASTAWQPTLLGCRDCLGADTAWVPTLLGC